MLWEDGAGGVGQRWARPRPPHPSTDHLAHHLSTLWQCILRLALGEGTTAAKEVVLGVEPRPTGT